MTDEEACDDGTNIGLYGGCAPGCEALGPRCGDGELQSSYETCDEGVDGTTTCNSRCQIPGTVLLMAEHTVAGDDVASPIVHSAAVTLWNGSIAAVFGGSDTWIWEFDPANGKTLRHRRITALDNTHIAARDVLSLTDGTLVVAGGVHEKVAVVLDEELQAKWTYSQPESTPDADGGFVGVAAMPGGFAMAAWHLRTGTPRHSAYWVEGFTESGDRIWDTIEIIPDTVDVYARGFGALPEGKSVLLTDDPEGTSFRIYGSLGGVIASRSLDDLSDSNWSLCPGEEGFFILGESGVLAGFDPGGNLVSGAVAPVVPSSIPMVSCLATKAGAPIVVSLSPGDTSGTTMVTTVGFADGQAAWTTEVPLDFRTYLTYGPALLLDEEQDRVWIVGGGWNAEEDRFLYAIAVAI